MWGRGVEKQVLRLPLVAQDDTSVVVEPQVLRFAQDDMFVAGLGAQDDMFCGWGGGGEKAGSFDVWGRGEGPGLKPVFWCVGTVA